MWIKVGDIQDEQNFLNHCKYLVNINLNIFVEIS